MKNIYYIIFLSIVLLSCGKEDFITHINKGEENNVEIYVSNITPTVLERVAFNISESKDNPLKSVSWTFGDGEKSEVKEVVHQYESAGEYAVTATLTTMSNDIIIKRININVEGKSLYSSISNFNKNKIWIAAHRGNSGNPSIPENSIASIQNCIAKNSYIDIVEVDVRQTKDGVIILMHDETIDRTTTGTGKVSDLTYDEIKKYSLKLSDGTVTPYTVPTLRDIFLAARGKIFFDLDFINKISPKALFDIVYSCGMIDQVLFYCAHNIEVINSLKSYSKFVNIFARCDNTSDAEMFKNMGVDVAQVSTGNVFNTDIAYSMDSGGVISFSNILNQNGYYIDAEMLKNDFSGVNKMIEKKVNIIQTDNPEILHNYLKSLGKR